MSSISLPKALHQNTYVLFVEATLWVLGQELDDLLVGHLIDLRKIYHFAMT